MRTVPIDVQIGTAPNIYMRTRFEKNTVYIPAPNMPRIPYFHIKKMNIIHPFEKCITHVVEDAVRLNLIFLHTQYHISQTQTIHHLLPLLLTHVFHPERMARWWTPCRRYAFSISRVPTHPIAFIDIAFRHNWHPFDGTSFAMGSRSTTHRPTSITLFIFSNIGANHRYRLHIIARHPNIPP